MANPVLTRERLQYSEALRLWRERRNMTRNVLARAMDYDPSSVSRIESGSTAPSESFTRRAEEVLQTGGALWDLWEALGNQRSGAVARMPEHDLRTVELVGWLADHSAHSFQDLYSAVCAGMTRISAEPPSQRHGREYAKRHVSRDGIARAIRSYYGTGGFYTATVAGAELPLSMLSCESWLDPNLTLGGTEERFRYQPPVPLPYDLDDFAVAVAVERLADAELNGTVLVNNPLYRLLDLDLRAGAVDATVSTVPFAEHAMTTELMEGELLTAVAHAGTEFPLRDRYLPSAAAAFDLSSRACVGGPTTLLAVARRRTDGTRDYVLFVQERSNSVVNLTGKLAVVPKGFHQPTGEAADEIAVSATLRRELEEELLGREDLEQVNGQRHSQVDLLHPQNLTAPAAWLLERPEAWRTECTGFGFNMLTSNFEFACLIVIEDESWWTQFGHLVVINWEAERVYRYSSLDTAALESLARDPRWGNESLFGYLQGLRRLSESGERARVAVPPIEVTL